MLLGVVTTDLADFAIEASGKVEEKRD